MGAIALCTTEELLYRGAMRCHLAMGDANAALELYGILESELARCGLPSPSRETREIPKAAFAVPKE